MYLTRYQFQIRPWRRDYEVRLRCVVALIYFCPSRSIVLVLPPLLFFFYSIILCASMCDTQPSPVGSEGKANTSKLKLVHCWPILTRNPRRIHAHILHISYGAPVHTPFFVELATVFPGKKNTPTEEYIAAAIQDENGRKTTQPFSTSTFEYENENKSGKARHENEHELRNIENFKNKLIRAELCRTRSVYKKSILEY